MQTRINKSQKAIEDKCQAGRVKDRAASPQSFHEERDCFNLSAKRLLIIHNLRALLALLQGTVGIKMNGCHCRPPKNTNRQTGKWQTTQCTLLCVHTCMHLFLCTQVHVGRHIHIDVSMYREAREQLWVSFLRCHPPCILDTSFLTGPEFIGLAV